MNPESIGKYRILELIATGGQGAVYRAYDPSSGNFVAVKVLHAFYSTDAAFVQRFRREASLVRAIDHENVVKIFDFGQSDDLYFMAMEFMPESLSGLISITGKLPPERAVSLAIGISDGIGQAHKQGIVHRDIKPQNVLLTPDGVAKVTDFGIARSEMLNTMTATGVTMGTPYYMSPEQAAGERADSRSDVYSLGCLLYQLLSGDVPFAGDTPLVILRRHIDEAHVPLSVVDPGIPSRITEVVEKAMAKKPSDRFSDSNEFAAALRRAVGLVSEKADEPSSTTKLPPTKVPKTTTTSDSREPETKVPTVPAANGPTIESARPTATPKSTAASPPTEGKSRQQSETPTVGAGGPSQPVKLSNSNIPWRNEGSRRPLLTILAALIGIVAMGGALIGNSDTVQCWLNMPQCDDWTEIDWEPAPTAVVSAEDGPISTAGATIQNVTPRLGGSQSFVFYDAGVTVFLIEVRDENGNPIEGVQAFGEYQSPVDVAPIDQVSDTNGILVFELPFDGTAGNYDIVIKELLFDEQVSVTGNEPTDGYYHLSRVVFPTSTEPHIRSYQRYITENASGDSVVVYELDVRDGFGEPVIGAQATGEYYTPELDGSFDQFSDADGILKVELPYIGTEDFYTIIVQSLMLDEQAFPADPTVFDGSLYLSEDDFQRLLVLPE